MSSAKRCKGSERRTRAAKLRTDAIMETRSMKPYFKTKLGALYNADSAGFLTTLPDGLFTSIVTDPQYGLSFMSKKWDYDVPGVDLWRECLRVLRPGAHALIFAGSRTQHRMAVNVEDAGFALKDTLMWLYGSGFPKSTNISKQLDKREGAEQEAKLWDGWGTHLKPAYEPILLATKPNAGSYAENALEYGVAGLNIGGCRIVGGLVADQSARTRGGSGVYGTAASGTISPPSPLGRFPANVLLDEVAAEMVDEQSGFSRSSGLKGACGSMGYKGGAEGYTDMTSPTDSGGASRFFYVAKASPSERGANIHPTVKPLKLMKYLCELVRYPGGSWILEPFAGSGTTLLGCEMLGVPWMGIERDESYCEIAANRLTEAING